MYGIKLSPQLCLGAEPLMQLIWGRCEGPVWTRAPLRGHYSYLCAARHTVSLVRRLGCKRFCARLALVGGHCA